MLGEWLYDFKFILKSVFGNRFDEKFSKSILKLDKDFIMEFIFKTFEKSRDFSKLWRWTHFLFKFSFPHIVVIIFLISETETK